MLGPEVATRPRRASTVLARAPPTRDHSALGVRRRGACQRDVAASCSWCRIPRSFADRPDTSSDAGGASCPQQCSGGGVWCDLDGEVDVHGGGDPRAQEIWPRARARTGEPKWEPSCTATQPPSHIRRRQANVGAGERPTGRHRATSSDWRELIWEQEAAGSNPAIPTNQIATPAAGGGFCRAAPRRCDSSSASCLTSGP
jgi:hypothetical protein